METDSAPAPDRENDPPDYADRSNQMEKARHPFVLPPRAWWRVLGRTFQQFGNDAIGTVAAGCAFFTLLAIFPLLSSAAILYGLIAAPEDVVAHFSRFSGIMPDAAHQLLTDRAEALAGAASGTLGTGLAVSLATTLWSSSQTVRSLLAALNITYKEPNRRSFLKLNLLIVIIMLTGLFVFMVLQFMIAVVPTLLRQYWLGDGTEMFIAIMRWPALGVMLALGLMLLFRLAPNRADAQWTWILPGAIFASIGWILISALFSLYVSFSGNYSAFYGSIGAAIILLLWLFWSYMIIFLGAELNAELEHEVARDTTTGEPSALGSRNAVMADHVAGDFE